METIVVENLVKYYGRVKAVDKLSFTVHRGEIYVILGPNGAGKTTTIKAVSGLIRFDSGKITVMGIDVKKNPIRVKSKLGIMPELPNLFGDLTVRENLLFLAKLYGLSRNMARKRLDYLVKLLNLNRILNVKYDVLSKGMKRRVDLAAALIHDPDILILDEPTSGLDVKYAIIIRLLIKSLREKGKTILLTTHNIPEAIELADRILVIDRGTKVFEGTPSELRKIAGYSSVIEIVFNYMDDEVKKDIYSLWGRGNVAIKGVIVRVSGLDTTKVLNDLSYIIKKHGILVEQINTSSIPWEQVLLRVLEKR